MNPEEKTIKIIPFFISSIKYFKWLIIGQFIIAIIWAIDLSLRPYLIKIMLDKITNLEPTMVFNTITIPAVLYILLSALNILATRFNAHIWLYLNSGLKKHVGMILMDRMFQHSYNFYLNNFAGNMSSKIKDVMSGIPDLSKIFIEKIFSSALALIIAIYTMWQTNYIFAISLAIWVIIYLAISLKMSSQGKILYKQAAEARGNAIGHIVDVLSNILSIRLFNTRRSENKLLSSVLQKYVEGDQARDRYVIKLLTFQGFSFVIYQTICIYWLIKGLSQQNISSGDFALVFTLNISVVNCLWSLSREISAFAELYGNLYQALNKIYSPIEIKDKEGAKKLIVTKGEIIFKNVNFNYINDQPIFSDKCIVIKPGEKVGLVGYSGVGKTTFVNLILRLFDIKSGQIFIDGHDINHVTQDSLRESIAFIPQEPILFHRSLFENIRYGNVNASYEEVIKAARLANAHEFIIASPKGYDTLVGERGIKLSGGQRQRITIARAILKKAPILILDEATSQLDSITENYIQESISRLMHGRTTIVIAHRLSTLLSMDRILVFDKGKIVEDGTHKDLMSRNTLYKKFWNAQIGGFLPTQN